MEEDNREPDKFECSITTSCDLCKTAIKHIGELMEEGKQVRIKLTEDRIGGLKRGFHITVVKAV